jgi:hypothetical protein
MSYSGEVLIYLQKVKAYFQNDEKAREYFFVELDEVKFYKYVGDIAQENYDKNGEAILTVEQFDSVRIQMYNFELNKKTQKSDIKIISNVDKIFLDHNGYEKICLN